MNNYRKHFNLNLSIAPIIAIGMAVLMTACASSSGRDPNNPFPRAEYRFVGLTTATEGTHLGTIELDEVALRSQLPQNADFSTRVVDYSLEGSPDINNFYEVERIAANNFARLRFSDPQDLNRNFRLGYVLQEFDASAFTVVAEIRHTTTDGGSHVLVRRVPVRVAAVGNIVNDVNDFLGFAGRGGGLVNASVDKLFDNGNITTPLRNIPANTAIPALFGAGANAADALINLEDLSSVTFTPSPAEAQFFSPSETRTKGTVVRADLFETTDNNATQELEITINLITTSLANATLRYSIPMNTALTVINGNNATAGSFINALFELNRTVTTEELISVDSTEFGASVTDVRVAFSFNYERNVYEERPATAIRKALNYRAVGSVNENSRGGRIVGRLGNVLAALGIAENSVLPEGYDFLPTIYYRLNQDNSGASDTACRQRYYVDYQAGNAVKVQPDDRISAPHKLNYESTDSAANPDTCYLVASLDGENYRDVIGTPSSEDLENVVRITGTRRSTSPAVCTDNVTAARNLACSYVASVNIELANVNEPAMLSVADRNASFYEGNFGSAVINGTTTLRPGLEVVTGIHINATDLSPRLISLANLTFIDEDRNAAGDNLPTQGLPEIVGVRPELPAGLEPNQLFSVNRINATAAILNLRRNVRSNIDFESMTPDANGFVGYTLTLRTTDNSTAALYRDTTFAVPVRDVIFKPEAITGPAGIPGYNPTSGLSRVRIPAVAGDPLAGDIDARDVVAQRILPGFQQFAFNGGPVLGQFSARDPETNNSAGIEFQYNMTIQLESRNAWQLLRQVFDLGGASEEDKRTALQGFASTVEGRLASNFRLVGNTLNLVGLGLTPLADTEIGAGGLENADVTAPPVDFHVPIVAFNPLASENSSDGTVLSVPVSVRYNSTSAGGVGQPAVRFASGSYLGVLSEDDRTGANADVIAVHQSIDPNRPAFAPTKRVTNPVIDESYHLVTAAQLPGFIGSLPAATAAALRTMFLGDDAPYDLSDTGEFKIDADTGAVSLARSNQVLHFTGRHSYPLLMRVLPTSNLTLPIAEQFLRSDYSLLLVLLEDTNEIPRIRNIRAAAAGVDANDISLSVSLAELADGSNKYALNETLAILTILDDNPMEEGGFSDIDFSQDFFGARQISESVLNRAGTHYEANYEIILAKEPDFEFFGESVIQRLVFTDAGTYTADLSNPMGPPMLSDPVADQLEASIDASATIRDVNEPINLRVFQETAPDSNEYSLSAAGTVPGLKVAEKAPVNTQLDDYLIYLDDPEGRVSATNVPSYTITTNPSSLEGALSLNYLPDVDVVMLPAPPLYASYELVVADTDILENAGDGLVFDVTVRVTENVTGLNFTAPTHPDALFNPPLTSAITFKVKVENDGTDRALPDLADIQLDLTEQQAVDLLDGSSQERTLMHLFNISDLHSDYDEFFAGTQPPLRAANLEAKITNIIFPSANADALTGEERFGVFELFTNNTAADTGETNFLLKEGRFIDRSLLGERIDAVLSVSPVSPGSGIEGASVMHVNVTIPASAMPEEVVFADAQGIPNAAAQTPPVYNFAYRQSSYANPISTSPCRSTDTNAITLDDGQCYRTVTVPVTPDSSVEVAERRPRRVGTAGYYRGTLPEVVTRTETPDEFGIVFVDDDVAVEELDVYELRSDGSLAPSAAFDDYFNVKFNMTYADTTGANPRSALGISLKEHPLPAIPTVLDTRVLSEGAKEETLSYFLVAVLGPKADVGTSSVDATKRAIAQLNFDVSQAIPGEAPVTFQRRGCPTFLEDIIPLCKEEHLTNTSFDLEAHYGLAADIALTTDPWVPIGSPTTPFNGSLDGYGHTISGLTTDGVGNHAGLFGYIKDAEIRNLYIHALDVKTNTDENSYAGILAGQALNSTIENVHTNITLPSSGGSVEAIARQYRNGGTLFGDVNFPSDAFAGGLVGHSTGGSIHNSSAVSDTTIAARSVLRLDAAPTNTVTAAGGLVGFNEGSSVTDSFATVLANGGVLAEGGIPRAGTSSDPSNLYASAGGLVGDHRGEIVNSYAVIRDSITAQVAAGPLPDDPVLTSTAETLSAGGLVGRIRNKDNLITDSYAIAKQVSATKLVSAVHGGAGRVSRAGGLVGFVDGSVGLDTGESHLDLSNVYAIATNIRSNGTDGVAGGLIGGRTGTAAAMIALPVLNSYYNSTRNDFDTSGNAITAFNNDFGGFRGGSRLQCATSDDTTCGTNDADATFVDWDTAVWDFGDATTVPVLLSSPPCRLGVECRF